LILIAQNEHEAERRGFSALILAFANLPLLQQQQRNLCLPSSLNTLKVDPQLADDDAVAITFFYKGISIAI
jgi:hypothetical protein